MQHLPRQGPRPSRPLSPPFLAIPSLNRVERYRLKERLNFGAPGGWVLKLWGTQSCELCVSVIFDRLLKLYLHTV